MAFKEIGIVTVTDTFTEAVWAISGRDCTAEMLQRH